jgi:hypothetical protein
MEVLLWKKSPESEAERNMRYELWVDSQLSRIRLARKQKEKTAQEIGMLLFRILILDSQRAENSVSKCISGAYLFGTRRPYIVVEYLWK